MKNPTETINCKASLLTNPCKKKFKEYYFFILFFCLFVLIFTLILQNTFQLISCFAFQQE